MAYTNDPKQPKVRRDAVLFAKKHGVRCAARRYGVSPGTISKWKARAKVIGLHPIPTYPSTPRSSPTAISNAIADRIVALRFETNGRCAEVIHKLLENEGTTVSLNTVRRTLDRRGLVKKRSPWKRYHPPMRRPSVVSAGDLLQVDTIHLMKNQKERIYIFTLIDLHSRWVHAWASEKISARIALLFLYHAKQQAPFQFQVVQSDHGPEFSTHFTERLGATHRHSRVRKPNDNAHVERFNRTLQEEFLNHLSVDVALINEKLPEYLNYYNCQRLHLGIGLQTPQDILSKCFQGVG
jgi:transposase InsO family protein